MSKKITITLTDKTYQKLKDYLCAKYGEQRALSLTIETAIKKFLD